MVSVMFHHGSRQYEVEVKRERRSDYRLRIRKPGRISAVIPMKASLESLEKFMEERRREIEVYLDRMVDYISKMPEYHFEDGDIIHFAGQDFRLKIDKILPNRSLKAELDPNKLEIQVYSCTKVKSPAAFQYGQCVLPGFGDSHPSQVDSDPEAVAYAVENALMGYSKIWLEQRVTYYSQKLGVSPSGLRVGRAKTRYGSCSSRGQLNFCWRILLAPMFISDYIVVHELAHLVHLNHSKAFYDVLGSVMPDYKEAQQWLKVYGARLEWPT